MEESIFTKIIKGEIPCHKVYEDERTLAFMDIRPIQTGMVVVVSKTQVEDFYDLDEADSMALWRTVNIIAKRLKKAFPAKKRIAVKIEGLEVPHVHVKLFPIDTPEDIDASPAAAGEPDHAALAQIASQLSEA